MTDYNKLIEQLNKEYKACANSVSAIGHRFALVQLLFDIDAVITKLEQLHQKLRNEVVEETHGYLKKWLDNSKWGIIDTDILLEDERVEHDVYQQLNEYLQIGINDVKGKDWGERYPIKAFSKDQIGGYLYNTIPSVNAFSCNRVWREDYVNSAIKHALIKLFNVIKDVITADGATKTSVQYTNYYCKLKTEMFAESIARNEIKNWKDRTINDLGIEELNFKIYKTIEKLNETECLKDKDEIVTDRKRQSCKKELEELCGVSEVPDNVATCYCLIKTLATVDNNKIVVDAAKAGKYIYENRNWLTNEQRTAFKSFDWKMQELCEIAETVKLTAAEEAVRRATKEAIKKNEGAKTFKKEVLKPYRVALDEDIIERIWDIVQFNNTFGVNIDKVSWSRWINGCDPDNYKYKPNETRGLIELYSAFKR